MFPIHCFSLACAAGTGAGAFALVGLAGAFAGAAGAEEVATFGTLAPTSEGVCPPQASELILFCVAV
jgi:hypothetical protein